MINKILDEFTWVREGIMSDNTYMVSAAHSFMRELILDRHLYLCKVIGFKFTTTVSHASSGSTNIVRNPAIGESYLEVMANLQDKTFLNVGSKQAVTQLALGPNDVPTTVTVNPAKESMDILYTDPYLCRVLDGSAKLEMQLAYDCGYRSAQYNSKTVGKEYWACETDYSVQDFFRILPDFRNPKLIRINYYNGATPDILRKLLADYREHQSALRKGERLWLSKYAL